MSLAMVERFAQDLNEPTDALPHQRLSNRELDVFRRVASGQTLTEIAIELSVSAKTVRTYKTRIIEKMQLPHEAALVRYAIRHKIFGEGEEICRAGDQRHARGGRDIPAKRARRADTPANPATFTRQRGDMHARSVR